MRTILSGGGDTPLPSLACAQLETPSGKHAKHMNSISARITQKFPI
jgi:hypothetical protein